MIIIDPLTVVLIKKVVHAAKTNSEAAKYLEINGKYRPRFEIFEDAAGNHAFDDHPEIFGITQNEGHIIRSFFQHNSARYNKEVGEQLEQLIEEA